MSDIIKNKLNAEINKPITEESQVIYILSCVRKILEMDEKKSKFKKLNFYCNWALHAEIEDLSSVREDLEKFLKSDMDAGAKVLTFTHFDEEFQAFLAEYNVITKIYSSQQNTFKFKKILAQIFADSQLVVKTISKTQIKINAGFFNDSRFEVGFEIKYLN